jgi:hypothetical protein
MKREAVRPYIFTIFVLAFLIRLAYAMITPPFQAPDEYSHYSYVKYIHERHELPIQPNPAIRDEQLQFHQAPLYYFVSAPLFHDGFGERIGLIGLRMVNIVFAMLTILMAYLFARLVFPQNPFVVGLICASVAFVPTFTYTSSTMRNGVLATFLASTGVYLCARALLSKTWTDERWGWIGVVGGLAVLAKLAAIGFLAGAGITLLLTSRSWRSAIVRTFWFCAGSILVAGWWFARNVILYGTLVMAVENGYRSSHTDLALAAHLKTMIITLFKTYWAVFGRINEIHFQDIYKFYWWFVGLALLGFIRYVMERRNEIAKEFLYFFFFAITLSLSSTLYYAYTFDSDQGRYMFPVIIPICTIIALGLNALFPRRYRRLVLSLVISTSVGINTIVLWRLVGIYY